MADKPDQYSGFGGRYRINPETGEREPFPEQESEPMPGSTPEPAKLTTKTPAPAAVKEQNNG